jgi:hypothetical protein
MELAGEKAGLIRPMASELAAGAVCKKARRCRLVTKKISVCHNNNEH